MQSFCDHYLALGQANGAEAARQAGYSAKRSKVAASELLSRPDVQAYLADKSRPVLAQLAEKHKLTLELIVEETANMIGFDVTQLLQYDDSGMATFRRLDELPAHVRRCIGAIETREIRVRGAVIGQVVKLKPWSKDHARDRGKELLEALAQRPPEAELSFGDRAQRLAAILDAGMKRRAAKAAG